MESAPEAAETFVTDDGRSLPVRVVVDGGDKGCGGGLLGLMVQALKTLRPGEIMEVRSTDLGVREDLPAWSRMTDHALLAAQQGDLRNRYFVRKA